MLTFSNHAFHEKIHYWYSLFEESKTPKRPMLMI